MSRAAPVDFAATKRCGRCSRRQPHAEYQVDPTRPDGYGGTCRTCLRSRAVAHRTAPARGPGGRPFLRPHRFYAASVVIEGRGEPFRLGVVALPPDVVAVQVLRALRGPLVVSEREVEVLQAWWRRRSVRGAAVLVELSASSIRWHLSNVLTRLKAGDHGGAWCVEEEAAPPPE